MKYQKRFRVLLSASMATASMLVPITNVYALGDTVYLTETTPRDFVSEDHEDTYGSGDTPNEYGMTDTYLYTDSSYRETPYPGDSYEETPHDDYLRTPEYPYTPGNPYETGTPYTPSEYPYGPEVPYTTPYTTPGYTHDTEDSYTMEYGPTSDGYYETGNTYTDYPHSESMPPETYDSYVNNYNLENVPSSGSSTNESTNKLEKESATASPAVEKAIPVVEVVKPAKAENKVQPKVEPKSESKPEVKAEAKAKVQPKVEPKSESKPEVKAEAKAKVGSKVESKSESKPEVKAEAEAKVGSKVESKAETKAEAVVEKEKTATEEVKVAPKQIEIKDIVAEDKIEQVMGNLKDVVVTEANYSAIKKVITKGLMQGYGDNNFKPQKEITRAEAAQVLAKLITEPVQKDVKILKDITPNKWFHDAVQKCVSAKIMVGYEDNSFKPNGTITKAEILVAVSNLQKVEPLEKETADKVLEKYKDKESIPAWARGYVAALIEKGIIQELNDTLNVTAPLTREQMAGILSQIIK